MTNQIEDQDDEDSVWRAAVRDVKPLRREAVVPPARKVVLSPLPRKTHTAPPVAVRPQESSEPNPGLDRRTAERLRRGKMPIEARLDLHGHNRISAYEALGRFILGAYGAGQRCVLVITGKSGGVLKSRVPEWLEEPGLRPIVLKTAPARPEHGGEGALYVLLRRQR